MLTKYLLLFLVVQASIATTIFPTEISIPGGTVYEVPNIVFPVLNETWTVHIDAENVLFGFNTLLASSGTCEFFLSSQCTNTTFTDEYPFFLGEIFNHWTINTMNNLDGIIYYNFIGQYNGTIRVIITHPVLPPPEDGTEIAYLGGFLAAASVLCLCTLGFWRLTYIKLRTLWGDWRRGEKKGGEERQPLI